jgi:hypothetical protein
MPAHELRADRAWLHEGAAIRAFRECQAIATFGAKEGALRIIGPASLTTDFRAFSIFHISEASFV